MKEELRLLSVSSLVRYISRRRRAKNLFVPWYDLGKGHLDPKHSQLSDRDHSLGEVRDRRSFSRKSEDVSTTVFGSCNGIFPKDQIPNLVQLYVQVTISTTFWLFGHDVALISKNDIRHLSPYRGGGKIRALHF